jgi:twin arginine-targeting protein translocase, TatA/E family
MLSSPIEWGVVAAVALLVFGPKKFPELGRALGQGIGNFKKAINEAQEQVTAGIDDVEKKDAKAKQDAKADKASYDDAPRSSTGESQTSDEGKEKASSSG